MSLGKILAAAVFAIANYRNFIKTVAVSACCTKFCKGTNNELCDLASQNFPLKIIQLKVYLADQICQFFIYQIMLILK